jgi:phosphoadenosine phosphosulfate reductase
MNRQAHLADAVVLLQRVATRHAPAALASSFGAQIEPGEDIRAGRWWWENPEQRECGLHQHPVQVVVRVVQAAA